MNICTKLLSNNPSIFGLFPFVVALIFLLPPNDSYAYDIRDGEIEIRINITTGGPSVTTNDIDDVELEEFFNLASCECTNPTFENSTFEVTYFLQPLIDNGVLPTAPQAVQLLMGSDCDNPLRDERENCVAISELQPVDINQLSSGFPATISTRDFIKLDDESCPNTESLTRNLFAIIDMGDDERWDVEDGTDHVFSLRNKETSEPETITVDTAPPRLPNNIETVAGEGAITITWDNVEGADVEFYQALCFRTDGQEATFNGDSPEYIIPTMECGANPDAVFTLDGETAATNPELKNLNPSNICGEMATETSTDLRIDGLENGATYRIALVAIDESGNASGIDLGETSPVPATDGWEFYVEEGGTAEGGHCFVATAAYGDYDHPWVLVLRDFRDHTLAKFGAGRAFTRWYYTHGPKWAHYIAPSSTRRAVSRVLLSPLVVGAAAWQYSSVFVKSLWVLMFGLFFWLRRSLKQHKRSA